MQLEDILKKDKSFNWSDEEMPNDSNEQTPGSSLEGSSGQRDIESNLKGPRHRHSKKHKYK